MAVNRIEKVTEGQGRQDVLLEQARRRIQLFTSSHVEGQRRTFSGIGKQDLSALSNANQDNPQGAAQQVEEVEEAPVTVKMPGGERVELPRMSKEDRAKVESILANSGENRLRLETAAIALGAAALAEARSNPDVLETEAYSAPLLNAANTTYEVYMATQGGANFDNSENNLMLLGVWGQEQNLHAYFDQVRHEQGLATETNTDIAELDAMIKEWPDDGSTELFSYSEIVHHEDGTVEVVEHIDVELSKIDAIMLRDKLQVGVDSLATFNTMSMMNLQRMVNDYQKAENIISNIMKLQHDTRKTMIQNIR